MNGGHEIDRQDGVPTVRLGVRQGAVHPDPGDVDQDVEAAEVGRRGVHRAFHLRFVAQVRRHGHDVRRGEPVADLRGRGIGGRAVTVHHGEPGAFLGEQHGGGGADAASAAGDERGLSLDAAHAPLYLECPNAARVATSAAGNE